MGRKDRLGDAGGGDAGREGTADVGTDDVGKNDVGTDDVGKNDVGTDDVGTDDVGTDDVGTDDVGRHSAGGEAPDDAGAAPSDDEPDGGRSLISRRRLLVGGALLGAAIPLVHELVPDAGIHRALEGEASAAEGTGAGHGGGHGGDGFATGFRPGEVDHRANGFNPTEILRDFDQGRTRRLASGRVLREWEIVAEDKEIEVAPGVKFAAWTYNGRVPGPTLRCREGERLRIHFANGSERAHTIHFHGIHPDTMDGVPGIGEEGGGGSIEPGESFTYEFDAEPFGCHLYHCHSLPLAAHIAKGLYGAFIVDPKKGRPEADEMVMVMNGFDTNFDASNEVYGVNTVGFHYVNEPIQVKRDELVRIYLINILERDLVNSFHVHANFFQHYPTGTSLEPTELTDTIVQGQGQRAILELRFPFPGRYMFHSHVTEFAELGWMGFFEVSK